jgi:hypothetical protein
MSYAPGMVAGRMEGLQTAVARRTTWEVETLYVVRENYQCRQTICNMQVSG